MARLYVVPDLLTPVLAHCSAGYVLQVQLPADQQADGRLPEDCLHHHDQGPSGHLRLRLGLLQAGLPIL